MLKIYEYNDLNTQNCIAYLNAANEVKITREINGEYSMAFSYPYDEKSEYIRVNRLIECEGQLFRVMKISRVNNGTIVLNIECEHVYNADAKAYHIQNVPDFIGKSPYEVIDYAFLNTPFSLIGEDDLSLLGLKRIDDDGFVIDFFSADKVTPYEVMNTVIENCGKGEIYIDNYRIGLVERIGRDTDIQLELRSNMQNISIERDITGLVTRLYPYGYEDLHIGSVNDEIQYIDSPNISIYGIREGFKDYSDYKEPEDVLNRGLWEFDAGNEERIDIPSINVSGKLIDLSKLSDYGQEMKINIGDRVRVSDGSVKIEERVIRMEEYPYEPEMGEISIGRVKKDLFFYLNQMGKINKKYTRISTTGGKVSAKAISGVVTADGVNVKNSDGTVTVMTDKIEMSDGNGTRFICGFSGGSFCFGVYDKSGAALYLSDDKMNIRGKVSAEELRIKGTEVETDENGNMYVNGKKVVTEE